MSKLKLFKVGDKVVRAVCCSEDEDFLNMLGEAAYYTVTSVHPRSHWLQVNGVSKRDDKHPWCHINFELYQEPDDELPPVPDSVYYPDMYTLLTGIPAVGGYIRVNCAEIPVYIGGYKPVY